jgi:uncharacterized membrane protein YkvA (DUF1232 family)
MVSAGAPEGGVPVPHQHSDFYQNLRRRIRDYVTKKGASGERTDVLLLAPDLFHLMTRMALDDRVDAKSKALLGLAIAYFLSPIDLMPEALLGPIGFLDDALLAAYAIDHVVNHGNEQIAREYWAGDEDLLIVVQRLTAMAGNLIGKSKWSKLQRVLGKKG